MLQPTIELLGELIGPPEEPQADLLRHLKKLVLLEYTPLEMLAPLSAGLGRDVELGEVIDAREWLLGQWGKLPEAPALREAFNEYWERSLMFRRDLLGVYQDMLENYVAMSKGQNVHSDGRPVLKVKPADLALLQQSVTRLDESMLASKLKAFSEYAALLSPKPNAHVQSLPRLAMSDE